MEKKTQCLVMLGTPYMFVISKERVHSKTNQKTLMFRGHRFFGIERSDTVCCTTTPVDHQGSWVYNY